MKKISKLFTKKKKKTGGSIVKLSPNFVQSLLQKMKLPKSNISNTNITRKLGYMKRNYNEKIKNITKKNNESSSEYSEAEIVNTSGPNWNIEVGNFRRREKIPKELQPTRKTKGATFIRIAPSYSKKIGGNLTLKNMEDTVRQKNTSELRSLLESVNTSNRTPEGITRKIEIHNHIFNYLIKHPYLLYNSRFQNTVYDRINELENHRQVHLTAEEKQTIETLKDIITNINYGRLSKDKVIQNSFELNR